MLKHSNAFTEALTSTKDAIVQSLDKLLNSGSLSEDRPGAASYIAQEAGRFFDENNVKGLAASLGAGALAGGISYTDKRVGESKRERLVRTMRNALLGTAGVGTAYAAGGLLHGINSLNNVDPATLRYEAQPGEQPTIVVGDPPDYGAETAALVGGTLGGLAAQSRTVATGTRNLLLGAGPRRAAGAILNPSRAVARAPIIEADMRVLRRYFDNVDSADAKELIKRYNSVVNNPAVSPEPLLELRRNLVPRGLLDRVRATNKDTTVRALLSRQLTGGGAGRALRGGVGGVLGSVGLQALYNHFYDNQE